MDYARVWSAQAVALTPYLVSVETDLTRGLNAFTLVGLPDKAVEESRDRVSSAIKHTGFESPKSRMHKVVISLAPADVRKEGPSFDLAIALSYLLAAGDVSFDPEPYLFIGELGLDGVLRSVRGVLPLVAAAQKAGKKAVFVPQENAREAALVRGVVVYGASTLRQVVEHLEEKARLANAAGKKGTDGAATPRRDKTLSPTPITELSGASASAAFALEDIRGQALAKRAAVIAAAGGHNLGLFGPPGTGKTMLARALVSLLPPLSFDEALEVNAIHSVAGALRDDTLITEPPLRSPHHTSSYVSIVGGGANPRPGEATLAHRGVLFLDEFPEFDRRVIEALRQPLEDRMITVSRSKGTVRFPARFTLVVALNPCPCGNFGHPKIACTCPPGALERYQRKVSGPIADRVDLWAGMGPVDLSDLGHRASDGVETTAAREAVLHARVHQQERLGEGRLNCELSPRELDTLVPLAPEVRKTLLAAGERLNLSPRAFHRVIKVARTIADLADAQEVETPHILEALQYRERPKQ